MVEEIRATTTTTELEQPTIEREKESIERERSFRSSPKLNTSPLHGLWALTNRDLKKWYKNPVMLLISLIQPIVWLALFGKALNFGSFISSAPGVSGPLANQIMLRTFGVTSYFSFLAPGMLAFIILFTAAFGGMSVVWDRRFGFLNKALSTPVDRGTVVVGKILQATIRSLIQAVIVLGIAIGLGMDTTHLSVLGIAGAFTILFMMSFGLSALFIMLALRSSDWQTQMAIINLLNLPLLFASNAYLPVKLMPTWLQNVVQFNPVSYANDATRQLLVGATASYPLWMDFSVLAVFAVILGTLGIVASWRLLTK
jgi:ABC-2 type transport system permease protein